MRTATSITSKRRRERWFYRAALLATDTLSIELAFVLSFWIRFDLQLTLYPEIAPSPDLYAATSLLVLPFWILVLAQVYGGGIPPSSEPA